MNKDWEKLMSDQVMRGYGKLTVSLVGHRVIIERECSQIDVPYRIALVCEPPYGEIHTLNISDGIRDRDLLSRVLSAGYATGDPEVSTKIG